MSRFEVLDWVFKNSKASYPETCAAVDLLTGQRVLTLVLPNHSFLARVKISWRAAKQAWNQVQHYELKV